MMLILDRALALSRLADIGAQAAECLLLELETWPKPGLVSHVDCGSHADMDADAFRASALVLKPYFQALAEAGARGVGLGRLRGIGIEAETAMLAATGGINTHRGAIFGLGLLCAAAGARAAGHAAPQCTLGGIVSRQWGDAIGHAPVVADSHGSRVRRRYGAGGARREAAAGFPSVYEIGVRALRRGARSAPGNAEASRVQACFELIAVLEDTNLLHRGGRAGLDFARDAAQKFLDAGGVGQLDWRRRAQQVHDQFVARWLSPGGSADLLAMSLFVTTWEKEASR